MSQKRVARLFHDAYMDSVELLSEVQGAKLSSNEVGVNEDDVLVDV